LGEAYSPPRPSKKEWVSPRGGGKEAETARKVSASEAGRSGKRRRRGKEHYESCKRLRLPVRWTVKGE